MHFARITLSVLTIFTALGWLPITAVSDAYAQVICNAGMPVHGYWNPDFAMLTYACANPDTHPNCAAANRRQY